MKCERGLLLRGAVPGGQIYRRTDKPGRKEERKCQSTMFFTWQLSATAVMAYKGDPCREAQLINASAPGQA